MNRTTIMLPPKLKLRAVERARELGISLGELIRRSLDRTLCGDETSTGEPDSLFADDAVFRGEAPEDLSIEHDRYLYGESE